VDIYDPIANALELTPMEFEFDSSCLVRTKIDAFPPGIYGTQDRSYMQTPEYKQKIAEISKNRWDASPQRKLVARETLMKATRKKVIADGIVFDSLSMCAEHYKVSVEAVRKRIKSPNYSFSYC